MSHYNSSGPINISGLIPKSIPDYPEDGRTTVAEETAPPSYSSNGNLVRRSQLLFPALGQRQFEADDQPPEVIRDLQQSDPNLNNIAKGIISSGWDYYGTGGGAPGSLSGVRPPIRSGQGSDLYVGYGEGAGLEDFAKREGSNNNLSSTGNMRIGPPNASHSQTGNAFMEAYNQFHYQLPVVQENSDQS